MESPTEFRFEVGPITEKDLADFKAAVKSQYSASFPPTFPTCFRKAEFQWLDEMGVDMRRLLHTEQEYEYLSPFKVGDKIVVVTRRTENRERRGMLFVTLETDLLVGTELKTKSSTCFVVRTAGAAP